ncbi:GNAT family N-acetyltransferase [Bacillus sp. FJAT-49705]|uniref:GNAT family N-acetyltransferase n=1 Tax=Cytobacillus citreus TaxID=2833586 RepID=A0ABS5NWM0_9BACI|nr:GNAT family N-acetyltransferase [Cytobacillus citreus]MBS4192230.1 GNAT family N-acetyltransferase [Cytobacillus citreus]
MNSIYEGTLIKNGQTLPFVVQPLTMEHLPSILEVQDQVVAHLNGRETLQPLTEEEFQYILEGKGMMIGAFSDEHLIAFRALLVPIIDEEHLGIDIGLTESELQKVIYQEISNVLPEYRGNQLQKTLASLIMKELAKHDHGFRYVCCTVAPFNIPSLNDKFSQGMRIAELKEKYGGSLRYIFVLDLGETAEFEWKESLYIPMGDTSAQQSKLAEGWRGIRMEERNGEMYVEYKR